jgi:hypothetical protein
MIELQPTDVCRLVADILRSHILDEPDLCAHVRPFMRSVSAVGLQKDAVAAELVETYRAARQAVDRLTKERERGLRAPSPCWPSEEAESLDHPESLVALYPPSIGRRR